MFPDASACQRKFCATAAFVLLLKADAVSVVGCELVPAVLVAVPVAGKLKLPRTVAAPLTSNVVAGVAVLSPTFALEPLPVWVRLEL